jgi:hypothetical protein
MQTTIPPPTWEAKNFTREHGTFENPVSKKRTIFRAHFHTSTRDSQPTPPPLTNFAGQGRNKQPGVNKGIRLG